MHGVIMPKLGLTMETGVIEKWNKKEGDEVEAGEVLFEVMTDKVSLEVEAYHSGYLRKILKHEGEEVPVTQVIAYIGDKDEEIPEISAPAGAGKEEEIRAGQKIEEEPAAVQKAGTAEDKLVEPAQVSVKAAKEEQISADRARIKISPLARNIAESKGVDISKITGTGPQGRIVKEDVENYLKSVEGRAVTPVLEKADWTLSDTGEGEKERIKISPLARSTAKEMGIDYTKEPIRGTGPGGRIVKEDILAYAELRKKAASLQAEQAERAAPAQAASAAGSPSGAPKVKSSGPLKGIRKVIAERMTYSAQTIPHITMTSVMNVDTLVAIREKIKDRVLEKYMAKITYTDFIIKAAATVLAEQPVVNASFQDSNRIIYEDINICVAVDTEAGLIVPTIYNCDRISLFDIARKRVELVEKAKQGKLTIEEISNGTFTISNLGMFGIRTFTAIINPPQGAILIVGEVYESPAVVSGRVESRKFMEVSIAVDHRIIDGADGSRYLQRLKELIENPETLLI